MRVQRGALRRLPLCMNAPKSKHSVQVGRHQSLAQRSPRRTMLERRRRRPRLQKFTSIYGETYLNLPREAVTGWVTR
jgi:hypothetical protein